MSQEEIWKNISHNCLKNKLVPEPLKALWKEKLSGSIFLEEWPFGMATLIESYPEDIFHGYSAEFIGSKKDGEAWKRMFEEIGFFAMEDDGGLIGLWFYSESIDSNTAPVIQLDNEGQLEVISKNIRDYPAAKAWWDAEGDDFLKAYDVVKAWSIKHNLGNLIEASKLGEEMNFYPDPNERFEEYYEAS